MTVLRIRDFATDDEGPVKGERQTEKRAEIIDGRESTFPIKNLESKIFDLARTISFRADLRRRRLRKASAIV